MASACGAPVAGDGCPWVLVEQGFAFRTAPRLAELRFFPAELSSDLGRCVHKQAAGHPESEFPRSSARPELLPEAVRRLRSHRWPSDYRNRSEPRRLQLAPPKSNVSSDVSPGSAAQRKASQRRSIAGIVAGVIPGRQPILVQLVIFWTFREKRMTTSACAAVAQVQFKELKSRIGLAAFVGRGSLDHGPFGLAAVVVSRCGGHAVPG